MRQSRRMGLYAAGNSGPIWFYDGENGGDVAKNSGGWNTNGTSGVGGTSGDYGTYLRVSASPDVAQATASAGMQTVNSVNFDRLTTLYFNVNSFIAADSQKIGVLSSGSNDSFVASVSPNGTGQYSVDVSSVTGSYRIGLHIRGNKNGRSGTIFVNKIWAE